MMNRNSDTSNPLMYRAARLYVELSTATTYLEKIEKALDNMDTEDSFIDKIGRPFISNMPKFKILEKDAEFIKQKLRRVCSGEIGIDEAGRMVREMLSYCYQAKGAFYEEKLKPYIEVIESEKE